ncbi:MAG: helix-turn-helix domain-containing protein [Patescibacteria group bacterium]
MEKQENEFLTVEEVAEKYRVAVATIYRMVRKGEIPAIKFGKVWRIKKNELEEKLSNK